LEANTIRDQGASQVMIRIRAVGADVTLGAVSGGAHTTLWSYSDTLAVWEPAITHMHADGWTIPDGGAIPKILRMPVEARSFHVEVVNGINVANATATAQPLRGGV
jgi:hypothetical protein